MYDLDSYDQKTKTRVDTCRMILCILVLFENRGLYRVGQKL